MKSLSGANPESKPNYRQQALAELNKLESKVILLNEMLDNVDTMRGEKFVAGDVYDVRFASRFVVMSGIPHPTGRSTHSKLVPYFQARAQKFKSGSPTLNRTIQNLLVSLYRMSSCSLSVFETLILPESPRYIPPNQRSDQHGTESSRIVQEG